MLPMSRVYEIPTHLHVEDALIAGLTPHQLLRLVAGASIAYALWDQLTFLPVAVRTALTGVAALLGVVFAILQPGDRPLDQWVFAAALFLVSPRSWRWQREVPSENLEVIEPDDEWADLVSTLDWADRAASEGAVNDHGAFWLPGLRGHAR
jgi:hypothetical protein